MLRVLCSILFLMMSLNAQAESSYYFIQKGQTHFSVDHQVYDLSIDGFREYLNTWGDEKKESTTYRYLHQNLSELESRDALGWFTSIAGLAVGMGVAFSAFAVGNSDRDLFYGMLIGGGAFAVTSFYVGYFAIMPDRSDIFKWINRHNRQKGTPPIEIETGWYWRVDPFSQSATVGFRLDF